MAVLNSGTTASSVCQNQYAEDEKKIHYTVMTVWNSETISAIQARVGTEPALTSACRNQYGEGEKNTLYNDGCFKFENHGLLRLPKSIWRRREKNQYAVMTA